MHAYIESRLHTIAARLALSALATASTVHAQLTTPIQTVYVDAVAAPGGDGSDWLHAFRDLQDALSIVPSHPGAITTDRFTVRIAQGIYRPDRATLNRDASFVVNSAAILLGGFGGLRSPDPDRQDLGQFVTVLSGDLLGNDGPNLSNMDDNARHVVTLNGSATITSYGTEYEPSQLSGLVISGGNADLASGAAVLCYPTAYVRIAQCTIRNNLAGSAPAIDLTTTTRSTITSCTISDNLAIDGPGAIRASTSRCQVYYSIFVRNQSTDGAGVIDGYDLDLGNSTFAENSGTYGGAVTVWGLASIHACRVVGNAASTDGGGVYVGSGQATFRGCLIAHNAAPSGAGVSIAPGGRADISNCTLTRNTATYGGAVAVLNGAVNVRVWNSILWQNTATRGSAIDGPAMSDYCVLPGQSAAPGTMLGAGIINADPRFVNPIGTSTAPRSWADKDYHILPTSPAIDAGTLPDPAILINPYYYTLDQSERLVNSTCAAYAKIDLGAYESQSYSCPLPVSTLYVRAGAPLGGNGRSWATAYRDIWDALDTPGVTDIWIAEGVYHPDRGTLDPTAYFRIEKPYVSLYGGFAGTETTLQQRTIAAHPTILSADLLSNDSTLPTSTLDNAQRILSVTRSYTQAFIVTISGLTFRAARYSGGREYAAAAVSLSGSDAPNPTFVISDCSFIDNHVEPVIPTTSTGYGSASPVQIGGNVLLTRCRFIGNSSTLAGGALTVYGSLTATECEFIGNSAARSGGALVVNTISGTSVLRRCSFVANAAVGLGYIGGGGAAIDRLSTIDTCRFVGNVVLSTGSVGDNSSSASGGAIQIRYGLATAISNSLFTGNRCAGTSFSYAAVAASDSTSMVNCTVADNASGPTLYSPSQAFAVDAFYDTYRNCIFWNSAAFGASVFSGPPLGTFSGPQLSNCLVQATPPGNAVNCRFLDPRFRNPTGPDGIIGTSDDDYSLRPNSPAIDAADASFLPASTTLDAIGNPRFVDILSVPNTGSGTPNFLDIGALEFSGRACPADFNASGSLSAQDIFDFLEAWFAASPTADFNASGTITPQDIFDFLAAWFAGCL